MSKLLLQLLSGTLLMFSMIFVCFAVKTLGIGYFLASGFCITAFVDVFRLYCRKD